MNKNPISAEIESLGIHELRTLARDLEMKSPTTKKREELIEYIKGRQEGRIPAQGKSKMGRPLKAHSNHEDLLLRLMLKQDDELDEKIEQAKPKHKFGEFVFEQEITDPKVGIMEYRMQEFEGVLRKTTKGSYYFINYQNISEKTYVMVDEIHIKENKLMIGDYIRCLAFFNEAKNVGYLKNVISINNIYIDQVKPCLNQEYILPNQILEQPDFYKGQCKVCEVENRNDAIEFIKTRAEEFSKQNIKTIVVALDISIETLIHLDRIPGITKVVTTYEDWASLSKDKLIDSHNLANSMFSRGEDVVVIVLDILQIYYVLGLAFQSQDKYTEEIEHLIKKTISQNRAATSSSISVYALYYSYEKEDYKEELKNINKITKN